MRNRITLQLSTLLLSALAGGCTVVGFGIGAVVDGMGEAMEIRPLSEALQSSAGTLMIVTTRSAVVEGRYEFLSLPTRAERDSIAHTLKGTRAPLAIGDTITIVRRNLLRPVVHGVLTGVKSTAVRVDDGTDETSVEIRDITELRDPQGLQWTGEQARQHVLEGNVMLVRTYDNVNRIPIAEVVSVAVEKDRYGKYIGGAIGLSLDIAWITALKGLRFH